MHALDVQDSPNKHGVMGSKSVGEPPLLLSASVLSAFQDALAAAKSGSARAGTSHTCALHLPCVLGGLGH